MNRTYEYRPTGVCSRRIFITLDGDTVGQVRFEGGCSGNTQGVSALVRGMRVQEAIERLRGIRCGSKETSCPDQLAQALQACLKEQNGG